METEVVDKLPTCAECTSEGRNEPKDAEYRVKTPMKITLNLCDEHFMGYVVSRLGKDTVRRLAMAQRAGRRVPSQ